MSSLACGGVSAREPAVHVSNQFQLFVSERIIPAADKYWTRLFGVQIAPSIKSLSPWKQLISRMEAFP